jgi:hypothetical protein
MRYPVAGYEDDYVVGLDVFHQLHCLVSGSTDLVTTMEHMLRRVEYSEQTSKSILPQTLQQLHDQSRRDGQLDEMDAYRYVQYCKMISGKLETPPKIYHLTRSKPVDSH